jgi:hypothetical protein
MKYSRAVRAAFFIGVLLACGSSQSKEWQNQGVQGLRDELKRLLAYEDDGQFMKAFFDDLEQVGFKVITKEGSSVTVGGSVVQLPPEPTAPFQIIGPDKGEHPVEGWPFVRFLTKREISKAPQSGVELSETTVIVGMANGKIVVVRPGKNTFSLIEPR